MSRRLHGAAIAFTTDGTMLVSVAHLTGAHDPAQLLKLALEDTGEAFIGVAVTARDARKVLARLDNAGAEAAAGIAAARQRRRRVTARSRRRTAS